MAQANSRTGPGTFAVASTVAAALTVAVPLAAAVAANAGWRSAVVLGRDRTVMPDGSNATVTDPSTSVR
jgi:hypothetical protein